MTYDRWLRGVGAVVVGAGALAVASCGDETITEGPGLDGRVLKLDIVSGQQQSAPAGSELPAALVVRVTDSDGNPLDGQIVNFRVTAGGGSVFGGASPTNSSGIAQERWTLGSTIGARHWRRGRWTRAQVRSGCMPASPRPRPSRSGDPLRHLAGSGAVSRAGRLAP